MDKKKIEILSTVALVVVLVLLLTHTFKQVKGKVAPFAAQFNKTAYQPGPLAGIKVAVVKENEKELEWGRDPFVLTEVSDESTRPKTLKLMGITYDDKGGKIMAIIDDEIVKVGSKAGKFIVKEIYKDRVILNDGQNDVTLKLE